MSIHRFLAPSVAGVDEHVYLSSDEATHATRVLRLRSGATVRVFDGRGREFLGRLDVTGRSEVSVRTVEEVVPAREAQVATTLAPTVLKGKQFDSVVKDATMLGVAAIRPILSTNTDVPHAAIAQPSMRTRWQRIAVASAKQSGRAVVPDVHDPVPLADYLQTAADELRVIFVEPTNTHVRDGLASLGDRPRPARASLMVGPEGGWTDDEVVLATECGWEAVTLGDRTLRADVMPIAALSVLFCLWGEWDSKPGDPKNS